MKSCVFARIVKGGGVLRNLLRQVKRHVKNTLLPPASNVDITLTLRKSHKTRLLLLRRRSNEECTIGELFVDGDFECYTLEDPVRETKIYGSTAIPAGTYELTITHSPRFKRDLPLLHDVPKFRGVRIHQGNTAKDTEGCILVGQEAGAYHVAKSRLAFQSLMTKLRKAERISITIRNAP